MRTRDAHEVLPCLARRQSITTIPCDPPGEGVHEAGQEFQTACVDHLAPRVEQFVGVTDIRLGLLQSLNVQKHERLTQMMIGAETADRTRRSTNDRLPVFWLPQLSHWTPIDTR
jgi:hypothetical protein